MLFENLNYAAIFNIAALVTIFLFLFILASIFPLRRHTVSGIPRFIINISFSAMVFIAASIIVKPLSFSIMSLPKEYSFGLLHFIRLPVYVNFIIGFLLMDLTFYWWHSANHRVPVLWRFHNIHHIDPDLDVTTSFRFHIVEILIATGFRALQVGMIGIQPVTYLIYEFVFTCSTMFHHSNVRLPIGLERVLIAIFVTPRMHSIHHSMVREETNSNYSVIFNWWDYIHKTLCLNISQSEITIGVPAYIEPSDNKFFRLLLLPFKRQREYWHMPDGTIPKRMINEMTKRTYLFK